jgi:NAD(P)H-hydrate epimerase
VQALFERLRGQRRTVVALDLPSGIDSDTGVALGAPLAADLTIAFGARKRGHLLGDGRRASGRLVVADIGIAFDAPQVRHIAMPQRQPLADDIHKYQRGGVLVMAGAAAGAARLTALAALRTGAGAVTLAGSQPPPVDAIMTASDAEALALLGTGKIRAVAFGPGLADTQRSRDWLLRLLAGTTPLVLDAGALALFDGPQDLFGTAVAPLVLTPHAGEFTRLFGAPGPDPVAAVRAAAVVAGAVVLLKGRETIIAAPDGQVAINTHATPWLATAGSGDVLTGIIAALLAQGLLPFEAAQAGAWLHGDAGLRGGAGMIADDIPGLLPLVLAGL